MNQPSGGNSDPQGARYLDGLILVGRGLEGGVRRQRDRATSVQTAPLLREREQSPIGDGYDQVDRLVSYKFEEAVHESGGIVGGDGVVETRLAIARELSRGEDAVVGADSNPMSRATRRPREGQGGGAVPVQYQDSCHFRIASLSVPVEQKRLPDSSAVRPPISLAALASDKGDCPACAPAHCWWRLRFDSRRCGPRLLFAPSSLETMRGRDTKNARPAYQDAVPSGSSIGPVPSAHLRR